MSASLRARLVAPPTAMLVAFGLLLAPSAANAAPPEPNPPYGTVFGHADLPSGASGGLAIELYAAGETVSQQAQGRGNYTFHNILPGSYRVEFVYSGPDGYLRTGWAPPGGQPGDNFTINAGDVIEVNGTVVFGGSISGTVSVPPGSSPQGININAYDSVGRTVGNAITGPGGVYTMTHVPVGRIRLSFVPTTPTLLAEYWNDKATLLAADSVIVTSRQTTTGISPSLARQTDLTGTVLKEVAGGGTAPAAGVTVRLLRLTDYASFTTTTNAQGQYWLSTVGMFEFSVAFFPPDGSGLAPQYWQDSDSYLESTVFEMDSSGVYTPGIDATLPLEGVIQGRVRYDVGTITNLSGAEVSLYRIAQSTGEFELVDIATTSTNGKFGFDSLTPGQYVVRATEGAGTLGLAPEYYDNKRTQASATRIEIAAGATETLVDMVLEPFSIATQRLAGPDRFATGVEITKQQFPGTDVGVPVVYIANGLNYPDALTAGPAAIEKGGALLLVTPTDIPASVRAELTRLAPEKIIVVGSAASVSASVKTALEAYVDSPSDVKRLGGADRFETSELVVRDAFPGGAPHALFATGLNYPDALAAGPAAGEFGAPIILVNSSVSTLDADTADLVTDLGVTSAYVLGSSATISTALQNDILDAMVPTGTFHTKSLDRLAGADRYATAVAVNEHFFLIADEAILATGAGFADALSGGPLAGAWGIPMYLSTPTCVPTSVIENFYDLGVSKAWLLGGTGTLSNDVKNLVTC